jgi:predicted transcriptional regulator
MSPRTFESLAGKLAVRPPSSLMHRPSRPAPPSRSAETAIDEDVTEPTTRAIAKSRASAKAVGAPRQVAFLLPPDLRDQLRERAHSTDKSQPDVVLDAIEATYGRLPDLIAETTDRSHLTGLFNRKPTRRHRVDTVTVSVRLPADAIATIDKLARDTNAASRTHLLVTALANYL